MIACAALSIALVLLPRQARPLPTIRSHDNRVPAGHLERGVLRVTLRARLGRWYPDGDRRPAPIVAAAFAGDDAIPTIPGPLL